MIKAHALTKRYGPVLTLGTVEKHVASIFGKLGLPASETDNRRVLAVLRYLASRPGRVLAWLR